MPRGLRANACLALAWLLTTAAIASEDATAPTAPPDPAALLARAFHNLYADDYIQTLEMSTRGRLGGGLTRRMQIIRKQSVDPGKALVRFTDPYEIRRTSILILENDEASDDFFVYLPAARITRHLSSAQRADSFFGTDFCYEDIEPKEAVDYVTRLVGSDFLGGRPCALVEIRTRDGIDSVYERMVSCIEVERGVIYWTDFYRKGAIVKRLEIDPASIRAIGTRFIPFEMTMKTLRSESETLLRTESYDLRPEIPDSLFTTWNLEAGSAKRDHSRSGPAE